MWTHSTPYRESQKTESSIEKHGRIALYRALNIGRVVGFIGSGVSIAYGRPSWIELIEGVIEQFDHWRKEAGPLPSNVQSLCDQMDFLIGRQANGSELDPPDLDKLASGDLTTILEIVDNLFGNVASLGHEGHRLGTLRANVAKGLKRDPGDVARSRFIKLIGGDSHLPQDLDWSSLDAEQKAYFFTAAGKVSAATQDELNPIHKIYGTLKIKRFLTLNFDIEIERYLAETLGIAGASTVSAQTQLRALINDFPAEQPSGAIARLMAIETGMERALLTVTMSEDNVGELVNFAMHPTAYSAQIFHLHGRIDDPENMVITERDYQRIYMPDDAGRRTFHEALESVFAGNDVLFIGVGMKETDIMRPLRQFVSRERSPDSDARRVFALMEQIVEGEPHLTLGEQIWGDRQKEIQRTLRLNIQYGVHTIVYGGIDGRYARMALRAMQAFASGRIDATSAKSVLDAAVKERDRCERMREGDQAGRLKFRQLLTDAEISELEELLECDLSSGCPRGSSASDSDQSESRIRKAITGYARSLESKVRVRALCRELESLADRSTQWWREWLRNPREREAIFHDHNVQRSRLIWVRHKADYESIEPGDPKPEMISKLQELGHAIGDGETPGGRRMLCVAIERGGGKGALTHLLQQRGYEKGYTHNSKAYYETIFPSTDYCGAFFAHLTFSMEFSSVINALTRFVAGRLAAIHDRSAAEQSEMETFPARALERFGAPGERNVTPAPQTIHRLTLLHRLLTLFEKSPQRDGQKIFICLSGVHRLCDGAGIARHPMHRAFFRLLSGQGLTKPDESSATFPIDLLALSGNIDHPIRYLSEEQELEAFDKQIRKLRESNGHEQNAELIRLVHEFERRPDLGIAIRHNTVLEPIAWHERYWQFRVSNEHTAAAARELAEWKPPFGPSALGVSSICNQHTDGNLPVATALNRYIQDSVAFSAWMCAAWKELSGFLKERSDRRETLQSWMQRLDAAVQRHQFSGLDEILSDYRRMDEADNLSHLAALYDAILRHLALFTLPIELSVLYDCPDIYQLLVANHGVDRDPNVFRRRLADVLETLCRRAFVIRVSAKIQGMQDQDMSEVAARHVRYVLHSQLRDYFAHKMRLSVPDDGDRIDFQMTIYCDQPRDLPTPTANHYQFLRRILDTQIRICRETLWPFYQLRNAEKFGMPRPEDRFFGGAADRSRNYNLAKRRLSELILSDERDLLEEPGIKLHSVSQRIRACYGLLRGAFSIGSISRLDGLEDGIVTDRDLLDAPFERFRSWLLSLANAAVGLDDLGPYIDAALSGQLSLDALDHPQQKGQGSDTATPKPQISRIYRPFYREEIAWLYNERGLISLVQGRLYDAIPLFERAHQIVRHRDEKDRKDPSFHAAEKRIQLNCAIAQIDRGNLVKARRILRSVATEIAFVNRTPAATTDLARAYLGVIDHLSGHLEQAQEAYRRIVDQANSRNQLRLASIFNRHWSDLSRLIGDMSEAEKRAEFAISTAMQSEQRDVLHLALLSRARIYRQQQRREEAQRLVEQCQAYARRLGVPRIEVEATQVLADIMLRQGEETLAGVMAAGAAALASRHGMRLRKISCLTLYGDILQERNQMDLARRVRSEARTSAERHGYQIKAGRLAEALARQSI